MAYLRNFAIPKDSWFSNVNIFELNEIGSTYENLLDEIFGFGNVSIPCRVPCFITSDDVFKYILENRKNNLEKDNDREQLLKDYYKNHKISMGNLASRYVKSKLRKADEEKSNGETAFRFFVDSVKDDSLVLFDEPENSLSAQWQMELSNFLRGAVREFNCQFIIATHSPFILSMSGARIYDLDSTPVCVNEWYKLENVRAYYELFDKNRDLFDIR